MADERILITVKTYPTLSRKYGETVCTAGIREDGSWVRIYPVPFRRLGEDQQYDKYDWVQSDFARSKKDPRPETLHPKDVTKVKKVGHVGTSGDWRERRRLLFGKVRIYDRLRPLIDDAKANRASLALFKPSKVTDFVWEQEERDWDSSKVAEMRNLTHQGELFSEETWRRTFKLIPKLPYSFSYRFQDADGKKSEMQILDWEIGALYWNCLRSCRDDEEKALVKVRQKYFDEFLTRDLHFYLGTTQEFHFRAPNPWVIIGVLPIPYEKQRELF